MGTMLQIGIGIMITLVAISSVKPSSALPFPGDFFGNKILGDNYPLTMDYLGTVEGKHYFADTNGTKKNWTEAKTYCETSSLKLASVDSKAQAEFLQEKLAVYESGDKFWTSAVESRSTSMLMWDNTTTDNHPDGSFYPYVYYMLPENLACGYVEVHHSDMGLFFYIEECSKLIFMICQI